jgi:hypothetical protein
MIEIKTDRLLLRSWRDSDLDPWAEMKADPEVRAQLGPLLTSQHAAASIRRFQEGIDRDAYGFWALELRATGEFIGMAGLDAVDEDTPVDGVEIGWRLARSAWGHGVRHRGSRRCPRLRLQPARTYRDPVDHDTGQRPVAGGHAAFGHGAVAGVRRSDRLPYGAMTPFTLLHSTARRRSGPAS